MSFHTVTPTYVPHAIFTNHGSPPCAWSCSEITQQDARVILLAIGAALVVGIVAAAIAKSRNSALGASELFLTAVAAIFGVFVAALLVALVVCLVSLAF